MSYDEQRISDQIDGGLHKMKEMEKKQTAVRFLLSHIADEGKNMIGRDIIEQALQMERDQIEEALNKSLSFLEWVATKSREFNMWSDKVQELHERISETEAAIRKATE